MSAGAVSTRSRTVIRPMAPAPPATTIALLTVPSRGDFALTSLVREPEVFLLAEVIEVHVLRLAERVEAFLAELATEARLAHAAERRRVVVGERIVDPERAGLDLVHRRQRVLQRAREDVGAEAVLRLRRHRDRFGA